MLEKLSSETGGRYYRPDEAGRISKDITYSEAGITVRETRDLWDMPVIFLVDRGAAGGGVDGAAQVGCDLKKLLTLAGVCVDAGGVTARADSYFLTVAGLGGEPDFDQRFTDWAKSLDQILHNEPGAKVDTLYGADATKANVEAKLRALASRPNPTMNWC